MGCEMRFRFPVVKLLELDVETLLLERPENLFTVVVAAHRAAQGTKGNERLRATVYLAKRLFGLGLSREAALERLRFVEWIIGLTTEQELSFRSELKSYEKEEEMPYVLSFERIARQEGLKDGLEQGMERGLEQGLVRGLQEGELNVSLRQLRRKLGGVSAAQEAAVRSLPVERVEALADALLDFTTSDDLDAWLASNS